MGRLWGPWGMEGFVGAAFSQVVEGAGILTIQRGLIALEQVEGLGRVGGFAEGHGGQRGVTAFFGVEVRGLIFERGGLEHAGAGHAPAGGRHGFDQKELVGGGGLKFLDIVGQETLPLLVGFGFEDEAAGQQAVAGGVLRRRLLACFCDGSCGAFRVGPVGLDLTGGCHMGGA